MTCAHAHEDAAYVLGALSPAERAAYLEHLDGCPACARAVREIAGLPGLLTRVPAEALTVPQADPPLPDTVLSELVGATRRDRRRRRWRAGIAAAAAAVAVSGGTLAVARSLEASTTEASGPGGEPTSLVGTPPAQPDWRAMAPIGAAPLSADLALTTVPWGTRLELTCSYRQEPAGSGWPREYALVVRTQDGRVRQVATWRARPGATARLSAATASSATDIDWVEVRTAAGEPVLRTVRAG